MQVSIQEIQTSSIQKPTGQGAKVRNGDLLHKPCDQRDVEFTSKTGGFLGFGSLLALCNSLRSPVLTFIGIPMMCSDTPKTKQNRLREMDTQSGRSITYSGLQSICNLYSISEAQINHIAAG